MLNRFDRDARGVAQRSRDAARERGSRTVEAEHVLLALAETSGGVARECLAPAGLDSEGVLAALDEEEARSLAAAGVARAEFERRRAARAPRRPGGAPRPSSPCSARCRRPWRAATAPSVRATCCWGSSPPSAGRSRARSRSPGWTAPSWSGGSRKRWRRGVEAAVH